MTFTDEVYPERELLVEHHTAVVRRLLSRLECRAFTEETDSGGYTAALLSTSRGGGLGSIDAHQHACHYGSR